MNNLITEPVGFKFTIAGFLAWGYSVLQGIDLTQAIGFLTLIIGFVIQVVSYIRNRRADRREKEADDRAREADARDRIRHDLEMQLLQQQLEASKHGVHIHGDSV